MVLAWLLLSSPCRVRIDEFVCLLCARVLITCYTEVAMLVRSVIDTSFPEN